MSIKSGLGKLKLSSSVQRFVDTAINGYDILVLPLSMKDCSIYEGLGFPKKNIVIHLIE
jgi:PIN domain nuclease of toxin-antitoxin system